MPAPLPSYLREVIVNDVADEIVRHRKGNLDSMLNNDEVAKKYSVGKTIVKRYLGDLNEEDREYRRKNLIYQTHKKNMETPGFRESREILNENRRRRPRNLNGILKRIKSTRLTNTKLFDRKNLMSDGFAFLLGLYQRTARSISNRISFQVNGEDEEEYVQKYFNEALNDDAKVTDKKSILNPGLRVLYFSSEFLTYTISVLTSNLEKPPYSLFTSDSRIDSYIKGYLHRGSNVVEVKRKNKLIDSKLSFPTFRFIQRKNLPFLRTVQEIIEGRGIETRSNAIGFIVTDLSSLNKMHSRKLLPPEKNSLLGNILEMNKVQFKRKTTSPYSRHPEFR